MALSSGNKVIASDYNSLFNTLEAIRAKHANRPGLSSTQSSRLRDSSLGGNRASTGSGTVMTPTQINKIKGAVNFLADSSPNLTSFRSSVGIPSVGSLVRATEIGSLNSTIANQNSQCAFCSFNSSFHASFHSSFNSRHHGSFHSSYNSGHCGSFRNFGSFNSSWNGVFC